MLTDNTARLLKGSFLVFQASNLGLQQVRHTVCGCVQPYSLTIDYNNSKVDESAAHQMVGKNCECINGNATSKEYRLSATHYIAQVRNISAHSGTTDELFTYLSKLGRGMDPEPEPSNPFLPLNSFSTNTTFPVRAASSSSCSLPIPTKLKSPIIQIRR